MSVVIYAPGRSGDIINALPLAYHLARRGRGEIIRFFVAKDFAAVLDGVSYVEPSIFDFWYSHQKDGLAECRRRHPDDTIVNMQAHKNADSRQLCESYQLEAWRLAGYLDEFGKHPLVFDRRDPRREKALLQKHGLETNQPFILIGLHGHSSPIGGADKIVKAITKNVKYRVVDLRTIQAERVYDLLGVMDKAMLIVSADSVLLHLARACRGTPVISLINEGWAGSVPPPGSIVKMRYDIVSAERVTAEVKYILELLEGAAGVQRAQAEAFSK